jgi:hypothetical protein
MQDRNVLIYDPNDAHFPNTPLTPPTKPQIRHPAYFKPQPSDHRDYQKVPALLFDGTESLAAGLDQVNFDSFCSVTSFSGSTPN